MEIDILKGFPGAIRPGKTRWFDPGRRHVPDDVAQTALREGWAREIGPSRVAAHQAAPRVHRVPRTIVVVGSGPSLRKKDVAYAAKRAELLVVNDNYRLALKAPWLYACDGDWWDHHIAAVRRDFAGECWTQDKAAAERHGLKWIESTNRPGLSTTPGLIHQGGSSGYQAINLAWHFGATKVVLLGFDMAGTGKRHWFGDHPEGLMQTSEAGYATQRAAFETLPGQLEELGLAVINCNPASAVRCLPIQPIEEALA